MLSNKVFYSVKPFIPRVVQLGLRRQIIRFKVKRSNQSWPIEHNAARKPEGWQGWPNDKQFALVLTHDVDTARGQSRCYQLMELEKKFGFRSAFYFVPERYVVNLTLLADLTKQGFEVGVHGLNHDGWLFESYNIFIQRAKLINQYLKDWNAVGFRAPSMHHNLDWIHELNIKYDASTYDTEVFEFESKGVGTIFPFWVKKKSSHAGYVELPYTLPQDFYLFVMMKEKNNDIWKKKLDWIANKGGMALIDTHPDYMNFRNLKKLEEYPVKYYERFLEYLKNYYENKFWHALPHQLTEFWRSFDRNPI